MYNSYLVEHYNYKLRFNNPDNKVHGANMGPTWVLSAPDGPMLAPWILLSGRSTTRIINYNKATLIKFLF